MPQDRIVPFLGGGPLLRSSTLLAGYGIVVALGGASIELVVATDISLQFLQVTNPGPEMESPYFLFRVYEKVALRIKERPALVGLIPKAGPTNGTAAPPPRRHGWHGRKPESGRAAELPAQSGRRRVVDTPPARNRERAPSQVKPGVVLLRGMLARVRSNT